MWILAAKLPNSDLDFAVDFFPPVSLGRGVAATPLQHTRNCGKSRDGGVATPWSATGGGVASAPLRSSPEQNYSGLRAFFLPRRMGE